MIQQYPWTKTPQFHSVVLAGASILLLAYFTLLSPASLEDDFMGVRVVHPKDLLSFLKNESDTQILKEVPPGVVPTYSLRNFDFFITSDNQPELKITAKKSNFYNEQSVVHAKEPLVTLKNGTMVSSREVIYNAPKFEMQFFGDVLITLTDGGVIQTDYTKVTLRPDLRVFIPMHHAVSGYLADSKGKVEFKSYGLDYLDQKSKTVKLLSNVTVSTHDQQQIRSDIAELNFQSNRLVFRMDEQKNFDRQFVQVHRSNMEIKSRVVEVLLKGSTVERVSALNDVSIQEKNFFSTSGKAIFYQKENRIELSEFPQVYQETDTITGDLIIYHRNDESIEVKQSNAIFKR